jgi:hypothetical protein
VSKSCGTLVAITTQRRRNRPFVAMQVAPKCPRPQALRELYLDAGSRIRRGEKPETADSVIAATPAATSR